VIANAGWQRTLRDAIARGEAAVLVVVAAATGSTPREAGAAMAVTATELAGTIGGGHLEYEAVRIAREALREAAPAAPWLVRFPLAARLGQCCGGVATLVFARVDADALPWLDVLCACTRASTPHAWACEIGKHAGASSRIVVTVDDVRGTLGSHALDSAAIAEARARLALPADDRRAHTAVVSVASTMLLVHVQRPEPFIVLVFGNGHVGSALVHVLAALPARIVWIDDRAQDFPQSVPVNVEVVASDAPASEVAAAPRGAYVAVMTHSHPLDFDVVEAALARDDWRYLGLIGSKAKRAQFERRLVARGLRPEALARLVCPIGQGPLRSKEPGVIAIAVAAEMLAVREARERGDAQVPQSQRGARRG
jgi:xanthine dehydrogenase accessory factor